LSGDTWGVVCGVFCLYPLLIFGLPAFAVGRYWGRVRITVESPRQVAAARRVDPTGFGSKTK
jgi:hypothetical protein